MRTGRIWLAAGLAAVGLWVSGCGKQLPDEARQLDEAVRMQRKYVNTFAFNMMGTYYLWEKEIESDLAAWENWEEPIAKVRAIRYKDARGNDIDRWTELTDDFSAFIGGVSGHTLTLGMDYALYFTDQSRTKVCAVVTFTYAGSPAEEAGLQRGDTILTVDGQEMTADNYKQVVREGLLGGKTVRLGLEGGNSLTLTPREMYENPVQKALILEGDGIKVGYLHYTSFTLDSIEDLVDVFGDFTAAGIDELVLDLRYNGGGYILTNTVLASVLAPEEALSSEAVFTQDVYNDVLTEALDEKPTRFAQAFTYKNSAGNLRVVTTTLARPGLKRVFVLSTGATASASECLVCGLRPYMDVVLVGQQTYGKYCAGMLMDAVGWYDSVQNSLEEGEYGKALPYVDNWGIYVMYARYADCHGVTLSMPDGILPDVEVKDNPLDGFPLGDPRETMLAAALSQIEGRTRSAGPPPAPPSLTPVPEGAHPRTTGVFIR